ncbi:MAG: hypothetical protein M0R17_02690 [Candidatus Omnitrophica bacterium]|nr:hypothetical protein [Candidatus Omnitrophota bacterium]
MKTTVIKFKDYFTYCTTCENKISIKYRDAYFYEAKPYCRTCRDTIIREKHKDE